MKPILKSLLYIKTQKNRDTELLFNVMMQIYLQTILSNEH